MTNKSDDSWRVGLFVSSSDPSKTCKMIAEGEEVIARYGRHKDFIKWLDDGAREASTRGWLAALADGHHCSGLDMHTREKLKEVLVYLASSTDSPT